ncbi:MAG: metallophosphoesterase [Candidatus Eremiobacteraeota bacterium]|nr:metallophosphoesterase [Candidatus Eremiobacteraeota bacterium]
MKIFALGDLHLAGDVSKSMGIFGENWKDHDKKIKKNWERVVGDEDLVLIPGDISWAITLEGVKSDLEWIDALPGKKVLIRGNHDYWWKSISKVRSILPPSVMAIQNDSLLFDDIAIAGTRLWDFYGSDFSDYIKWISRESIGLPPEKDLSADSDKIYNREIQKLNLSLESVHGRAKKIIVMLHFPPFDFSFKDNEITMTLQKFGIDICVFGHLHSLKKESMPKFPVKKWGIKFHLVSSDFVDFVPIRIL